MYTYTHIIDVSIVNGVCRAIEIATGPSHILSYHTISHYIPIFTYCHHKNLIMSYYYMMSLEMISAWCSYPSCCKHRFFWARLSKLRGEVVGFAKAAEHPDAGHPADGRRWPQFVGWHEWLSSGEWRERFGAMGIHITYEMSSEKKSY